METKEKLNLDEETAVHLAELFRTLGDPGRVRIAGPGVGNENAIGALGVQCPVAFKGDRQRAEQAAALQPEFGIEIGTVTLAFVKPKTVN